jgi:hypothetical protein
MLQVKVLKGMPFLVDNSKKEIYAYEKPIPAQPFFLGTFNPDTEEYLLIDNWQAAFDARLSEYRQTEVPRLRTK